MNTLLEYPLAICSDGNNGIYFGDPLLKHYDNGSTEVIPTIISPNQNQPFYLHLELDKHNVLWGICIVNQNHYLVKFFGNQMLDFVLLEDLDFDVNDVDFRIHDLTIDAFNNLILTHNKGVSLYNEHGVLDINKPSNPFTIEAYPNPSKEGFTIQLNLQTNGQYLLLNAHGQQMKNGTIQTGSTFEIPKQARGIYFLRVIVNGSSQTIKLVQQ